MSADRPLVSVPPVRRDAGFSLVEVLVSMIVIGTVMGAMAPFLVRSFSVVGQERNRQVAIEVANDALERARALDPSSLLAGRGKIETQRQWTAAPSAVTGYLATMVQDWDPLLPVTSTAGLQAPLPTVTTPVTVVGTPFTQSWYVGRCWQTKASTVNAAPCGTARLAPATDVPFFRIVTAVTWSHRSCPGSSCIYVASTLASIGPDPRFDLNRPPPVITDPVDQTGYRGVLEDPLQLVVTGGSLPLAWTSSGLPPGLQVSPLGGLITGTPTAAGTYAVVITATGRDGKADATYFSWIIALVPTLTSPGTQRNTVGKVISPLAITAVGGLLPLRWAASGQPAGVTFDTTTGVFTGTPTTVLTRNVVVTITDAGLPVPRTATVTFSWQVISQVVLYNPGPQTIASNTDVGQGAFAFYATGGATPYVFRADNLPTSLTLNPATGAVTGDIIGTRYLITAYVTDSLGDVDSIIILLTVTQSGNDLRVTTPNPSSPDRSTAVNTTPAAVYLTAAAAGGSTPYTWTASGLPPGLTLSTGGVIGGKPTTKGSYVVSYTVRDRYSYTAVLMFTWTVT